MSPMPHTFPDRGILHLLYYTSSNSSQHAKISQPSWSGLPSPQRRHSCRRFGPRAHFGCGSAALWGGQSCPQPPFRRLFRAVRESSEPQSPAESRRQPGLAAPQSGKPQPKSVPEARRAKENSPGREPWVRIANLPAPARGERSTRLQFFRPVPGLACLSRRSQCSRTGLLSDAPPGLGLRQNRRALRRIQRGVIRFVRNAHQNQKVCGITS
jgi:hypothetical protein